MISKTIDDNWFYATPHRLLRLLTIYVKGDMIIIIPALLLIALVGFFSLKFMCFVYAVFFALRSFGEMLYWFSHQFWEKKYRPDDFGFAKLSNDAIYILYQLLSLVWTVFWAAVAVGILWF